MVDMSEKAIEARISQIMGEITNGHGELDINNAVGLLVGKIVAVELLLIATNDRITRVADFAQQTGND